MVSAVLSTWTGALTEQTWVQGASAPQCPQLAEASPTADSGKSFRQGGDAVALIQTSLPGLPRTLSPTHTSGMDSPSHSEEEKCSRGLEDPPCWNCALCGTSCHRETSPAKGTYTSFHQPLLCWCSQKPTRRQYQRVCRSTAVKCRRQQTTKGARVAGSPCLAALLPQGWPLRNGRLPSS